MDTKEKEVYVKEIEKEGKKETVQDTLGDIWDLDGKMGDTNLKIDESMLPKDKEVDPFDFVTAMYVDTRKKEVKSDENKETNKKDEKKANIQKPHEKSKPITIPKKKKKQPRIYSNLYEDDYDDYYDEYDKYNMYQDDRY